MRLPRFRSIKVGGALIAVSAFILLSLPIVAVIQPQVAAQAPDGRISGATDRCESTEFDAVNFAINNLLLGPLSWAVGLQPIDVEAGWTWVDPNRRFRQISGRVTNSQLLYEDLPIVHDSHDQIFDVTLDRGQQDVLSDIITNLHLEWESAGFPEWAWPTPGDRVWAEGHWIFDCGHPAEVGGRNHYRTEIHPPRAVASIRDSFRRLPGTGQTPVQAKQTDLYIHGMGGFATTELYCGVEIILHPNPLKDGCGDPVSHPHFGTPIDTDYEFDIPLPPRPPVNGSDAALSYYFEDGPGNSLGVDPVLTPNMNANSPTCGERPTCPVLHVRVPLGGSGAQPTDVYARRIYAGWTAAPLGLTHHKVRLDHGILTNDHDLDPSDCECQLFWINVDRASQPWVRLGGYDRPTDPDTLCPFVDDNTLSSWDDNVGCGNGRLDFVGPTYFFYTGNGMPYSIAYVGIDQDCWDHLFSPNSHFLPGVGAAMGGCFLDPDDPGSPEDDDLNKGHVRDEIPAFVASTGPDSWDVVGPSYSMTTAIEQVPLGDEVSADVGVTNSCHPSKVSVPGPFTCTIEVENTGPGLSSDTKVEFRLKRDAGMTQYSIGTPTYVKKHFQVPEAPTTSGDCFLYRDLEPLTDVVRCSLGSVPLPPGKAVITVPVTVEQLGTFFAEADSSSSSRDSNAGNNGTDPLRVDALPGTTLTLTSSSNPAGANQDVTFTAIVTPNEGTGVPTGSVDIRYRPKGTTQDPFTPIIGSPFPLSGGTATSAPITAPEGSITLDISAEYSGDSNYGSSTGSLEQTFLSEPVSATETRVTASNNPATPSHSGSVSAFVSAVPSGAPVSVGTVQFRIDGEPLGPPDVLEDGEAFHTLPDDLPVGDHLITADYSGETGVFEPSAGSLTLTVVPDPPQATVTELSASASPSNAGETVTFTAHVTTFNRLPDGAVQFAIDGADLGEPVSVAVGAVEGSPGGPYGHGNATTRPISTLGPGDHRIVARYLGDSELLPSEAAITHTVGPLTSGGSSEVNLSASANPAPEGEPVTFTARITPPTAPTTTAGAGTRPIVASSAGDRIEMAAETETEYGSEELNKADLQDPVEKQRFAALTQRSPDPNENDFGHRLPLPAGDPGSPQNLETVQFKLDGVPIGSPVPVVNRQAISAPVFDLSPGPHEVTADYLAVAGPGSSSLEVTVGPAVEEPPTTQPPGSQPPGSQPPGSQPPGSQPPGSQPPGSQPPGSQPPGSQPPGSQPPGTGGQPSDDGGQRGTQRGPRPEPAATVPSGTAAAPVRGRPAFTGANVAQMVAIALVLGVAGALMVFTNGRRVRIRDNLGQR